MSGDIGYILISKDKGVSEIKTLFFYGAVVAVGNNWSRKTQEERVVGTSQRTYQNPEHGQSQNWLKWVLKLTQVSWPVMKSSGCPGNHEELSTSVPSAHWICPAFRPMSEPDNQKLLRAEQAKNQNYESKISLFLRNPRFFSSLFTASTWSSFLKMGSCIPLSEHKSRALYQVNFKEENY